MRAGPPPELLLPPATRLQDSSLATMQLLHAQAAGSAHEPGASAHSLVRLVAIPVIFAAGLLALLPLVLGHWLPSIQSHSSTLARVLRAASGGTMLALALVHIIPESYAQLQGLLPGDYPLGGAAVLVGLVAVLVVEWLVTYLSVAATQRKQQHKQQQLPTTNTPKAISAKAASSSSCASGSSSSCASGKHTAVPVAPPRAAAALEEGGSGCVLSAAPQLVASLTHNHGCARAPACHVSAARQQVVCCTMEAGCVVHSVTLGVALGVLTESRLVVTLMAVLAVHQAVEGLALGAVLAATRMSPRRRVALAVLYAATLPAGIAIGLGVAHSYDADSVAAKATQGVANGVSGGLLLHVSLISLLSAEFSSHELLHRPRLAAGLFAALVVGAGAMCALGVWA